MKVAAMLLSLLSLPAAAVQVGEAKLPDSWPDGARALQLNGAGLREYGWLNTDVYAAALYVTTPSHDARALVNSGELRVLHMQFFRDVSREDTIKAWDHYFAANCTDGCALPQAQIAAFEAFLPACKAGSTQTYVFDAAGVDVLGDGKLLGRIKDVGFARLLLSTWIGAAPTTTALRAALLGS